MGVAMFTLSRIGLIVSIGSLIVIAPIDVHSAESADDEKKVLEEIVVTAARREEGLQDASMSVSALTGASLNQIGAKELDDYFGFVPSINSASNTIGERGGKNVIIRGISNTRIASGPSALSSTTGYYLNDIPITLVDTDLFDVQRVEVLRGPQGTLYGAAAMGGTTKIILNSPNLVELEGAVQAGVSGIKGGDPTGDVNALLNVPIFEGVFGIRMVGSYRERDGFINTAIVPLDNTSGTIPSVVSSPVDVRPTPYSKRWVPSANVLTSTGASVSALYTPNDKLTAELTMLWQKSEYEDNNFVNKRFDGERLQEKYLLEPNGSEVTLSALNISYDAGPVTIISNTAFYTREYDEIVDWTQVTFRGGYSDVLDYIPATATLDTQIDLDTFTQEVRIESNSAAFDNSFMSRIDWVVGFFYLDEDNTTAQIQDGFGWEAAAPNNPLPIANDLLGVSQTLTNDQSEAVFFDITYNITENLAIGGGIRFFDLSTEIHGESLTRTNPDVPVVTDRNFSEDGDSIRLGISYDLSDDIRFFGTFSDGFRLGGATSPINLDTAPQCVPVLEENGLTEFADGRFDSDSVETYEVGVKTTLADGRATLNAAAYHTDWSGLQTQVRLGDISDVCFNVITANVGSAEVDGVEVELAALAAQDFSLQASLAYIDARIVDPGPGALTSPGDPILNVPEWSGSIVARYETRTDALGGGTFFAQGDLRYMDEREPVTGNTNPELTLEDYTLVGARVGFVFGDYRPTTVTLWIKNLLDDNVDLNARNRIGVPNVVVNRSLPRTFGVTLRKDF
jgi:outer membrane receptor protein involved in Fe transport